MRIFYIVLICLLVGQAAVAQDWEILKGKHFLVYYLEDKIFAKEVMKEAERYYNKIAGDLGYARYDKFWQWDDRVKIYIYRYKDEFISSTGAIKWATGMVRYDKKEISSFMENERFLDSLLPHELTHLIFRDFVGYGGHIPLWIDEGVAQWEEKYKKKIAINAVKMLIKEGSIIPIAELTHTDIRVKEDSTLARNFYAEAATVIGFLIDRFGGTRFTQFCRELRDGKDMNDALSSAYSNKIRNIDELEGKWIDWIKRYKSQ